ncbi:hypothetical protein KDJ56_18720 [Brevibacillus composti]|uniref:Uncharacterized protein n=1 Tax=Brevibacillus composti TaxID=2796470 RepID=A0A7T5EJP6_9BACL|nr:hypothetical protein [Brevibacillus composti]QQE73882.1 hypothetical protein JD108_18780 [Brevibacillus composti]QUO40967.1 hypothetical protein KDJ56_18720 [Brevibacillus composti]
MGTILLFVSVICVAVGTWRLLGIYKEGRPGGKLLWWVVASFGITLFFLLKLVTDTPALS